MSGERLMRRTVLGLMLTGVLAGGTYAQSQDPTPQQQDIQSDKKDIRNDKKDLQKDRIGRAHV